MTFSIAIPVHNGERYLGETLKSAVNQSRPADEILIVDDASIDSSISIIREFEREFTIRYIYNAQPSGFVDAWNRVIQLATCHYIILLHQDDLLAPNYIEVIEKAFQRYPQAKHAYSGYHYIDDKGARTGISPKPHGIEPILYAGKEYAHRYLEGVRTNQHIHRCPGVTTERTLLLTTCGYRKEAGIIADDDLFIRIGAFTDVISIREPLASYRNHAYSVTGSTSSMTLQLASDYMVQVRDLLRGITYLDTHDIAIIHSLAVRFIHLLFYEGLSNHNHEFIEQSLLLRSELHSLAPSAMDKYLPLWGNVLWCIADHDRHTLAFSSFIAKLIPIFVKIKKKIF
jgi:glycosyltransferase involved in cell wall biosynthesis